MTIRAYVVSPGLGGRSKQCFPFEDGDMAGALAASLDAGTLVRHLLPVAACGKAVEIESKEVEACDCMSCNASSCQHRKASWDGH